MGRRGHRQPRAGRRRRHAVLRHAAQLDAVHRERAAKSTASARRSKRRRSPTSGCGAGWCPGSVDDMAGMAERGVVGFKAFMCDSGLAGVSARRRPDAVATACGGGAARTAGGRARRERGDDATAGDGHRPGRARATSWRRARSSPSSRRSRARSSSPERPARSCTSSMSARAAASPWRPKHGRAAWMCRSRPARTICSSPTTISSAIGVVGQVRAAAARPDEHGGALGRAARRPRRHRRLRSFARRTVDEEGRRLPRVLGRHRRRAVHAAVLLERGLDGRRLRFERIVSLDCGEPRGSAFGFRAKGRLAVGNDADLVLLDPSRSYTLDAGDLHPAA